MEATAVSFDEMLFTDILDYLNAGKTLGAPEIIGLVTRLCTIAYMDDNVVDSVRAEALKLADAIIASAVDALPAAQGKSCKKAYERLRNNGERLSKMARAQSPIPS